MDEIDLLPFDLSEIKSSLPKAEHYEEQASSSQRNEIPTIFYYDMSKNKFLIIFNHMDFSYFRELGIEELGTRGGTQFDVQVLDSTFTPLGFDVQVYQDLTHKNIMKTIENFVNQDHTNTSCVMIAILTHGAGNGYLFAYEEPYHLNTITKLLQSQKLVLIPKVLILQACRGDLLDDGHQLEIDGLPRNLARIPTHIDFLILRSTVEGYLSFRNTESGSWMIQTLCDVIKEYHSTYDILQLITLVNMRVAQFISDHIHPDLNKKKQSVETTHQLTKFLKL